MRFLNRMTICALLVLLGTTGWVAAQPAQPAAPPEPPAIPVNRPRLQRPVTPLVPATPLVGNPLVPRTAPPPVQQLPAPLAPPNPNPLIQPAPGFPPTQPVNPTGAPGLAFDSELKDYTAKPGDLSAPFTFNITNVSKNEIVINSVRTSCGCTVAQLPSQPWHLPAGSNGQISVSVNLQGKVGVITKSVTAETSVGMKTVLVRVNIPAPSNQPTVASNMDMDRLRNQQMAAADRQIVFKNDCARCHAEPAKGKMGRELFTAVCSNCHESPNRASVVPDLHALKHPTNREYWKQWIAFGKPNSLMPAFATEHGGPLSATQIASLADYLDQTIKTTEGPVPLPAGLNAKGPEPIPGK
jgi:mono/diheme cytochrome c family protein